MGAKDRFMIHAYSSLSFTSFSSSAALSLPFLLSMQTNEHAIDDRDSAFLYFPIRIWGRGGRIDFEHEGTTEHTKKTGALATVDFYRIACSEIQN